MNPVTRKEERMNDTGRSEWPTNCAYCGHKRCHHDPVGYGGCQHEGQACPCMTFLAPTPTLASEVCNPHPAEREASA